jgi:hypothetical protein
VPCVTDVKRVALPALIPLPREDPPEDCSNLPVFQLGAGRSLEGASALVKSRSPNHEVIAPVVHSQDAGSVGIRTLFENVAVDSLSDIRSLRREP